MHTEILRPLTSLNFAHEISHKLLFLRVQILCIQQIAESTEIVFNSMTMRKIATIGNVTMHIMNSKTLDGKELCK